MELVGTRAFSFSVTTRICIVSCNQMSWWVFSSRYWLAFSICLHTRWCVLSCCQVSSTETSGKKKKQRPHSVHIVVKQWMLSQMSKSNHRYQIALWHPWYSIPPHTRREGVPLASTFGRSTPNESVLQSPSGSPYNLKSYCSVPFLLRFTGISHVGSD